jgi:DNA-binding IclR family transcriptional regulator
MVSRQLGIPKSSARNILLTLQARGYVDFSNDGYSLGVRTFELGALFLARTKLHAVALPRMEVLAREIGETCHLAILDGFEVVFIDKVESPNSLRYASRIGGRAPAYATAVGKALLSTQSDATVEALARASGLCRFTEHTITAVPALLDELSQVRQAGYAVDNEEESLGFRCVGAPIRDFANKAIAGLSVAGFVSRVTLDRLPDIAKLVTDACSDISAALGYAGSSFAPSSREER